MNMLEHYAKREKQLREEWFKDHVATFEEYVHPTIKEDVRKVMHRLVWARPGTTNYWCGYIISGSALMVYGDIGEAVYGWSSKITWDFLAGLELGYFNSKCCASEKGREFKDWDSVVAKSALMERFKEDPAMRKHFERVDGGMASLYQRDEWHHWLHDNGYDVFGDGWYEWAPEIGDVIAWRCQGHLVGIQMAVEQLKAKTT